MQAFRLTVFYDVLTVMSIKNAFLTQDKEGILCINETERLWSSS